MSTSPSLLDELRVQYESSRKTHDDRSEVEGYEAIDRRDPGRVKGELMPAAVGT